MWKIQIKLVKVKDSSEIDFLKYTKHFLPEKVIKNLCSSIVEPLFQYCYSFWGCCNLADILEVQRVQNRAARIFTNSYVDAPRRPLIQSLGWKTIEQLINRQVNLTACKYLKGIASKCLSNIFTKNALFICSQNQHRLAMLVSSVSCFICLK